MSPQPGITYYLQKQNLSHDIFGIVDQLTGKFRVYIFDERLGPKNSDHTISYLHYYLSDIHTFMDSKNTNLSRQCWWYKHEHVHNGMGNGDGPT